MLRLLRAAWPETTVFVSGHSYAGPAFSTETVVWEVATGKRVGNLEQVLAVTKDGERFRRPTSTSGASPSPPTTTGSTRRSGRAGRPT